MIPAVNERGYEGVIPLLDGYLNLYGRLGSDPATSLSPSEPPLGIGTRPCYMPLAEVLPEPSSS